MSAFRSGKLYCYILRKSQSSFHVNITGCATVSELKERILLKKQNTIVGVDDDQLKIWKVCAFELSNLNQPKLRAEKVLHVNRKSYNPIGQSSAARRRCFGWRRIVVEQIFRRKSGADPRYRGGSGW
jgi:hypothetical protein